MVMIGPWAKGMDNRSADHDIPRGTREDPGAACRNAVNVDFGNGGKGMRRKGFTRIYSAIGSKGGYSCPAGKFFIEQGCLKRFNADYSANTLYSGILGTEYAFYYLKDTGSVYFSDGIVALQIVGGVVSPWGMANPPAPVLSGIAGSYGQGVYLAALCWVDAAGVESGSSDFVSISLPTNSGIKFHNLPCDIVGAAAIRLYLSMPNGKELYHIADVDPEVSDYSISSGRYDESNTLDHLFVYRPPPGRIIRHYKGRMYVADSLGRVWYSDPFEHSHFRMSNYILFPSTVDIMEPVNGGIYFAYGNQTDFYAGTPESGFDISQKFNYGGVFGTGKKIQNSDDVCWQSQRGMVIGTADGQCKNIVEERVAVESAVSGATLIREQDGIRQFIASIHQPTISKLAATSFIEAEIIRRGA